MGISTENSGEQILPAKPSGVAKRARRPPNIGKLKAILKKCLNSRNFSPLPLVVKALKSGAVTGDAICFKLLETCYQKAGREEEEYAAELKLVREKLSESPPTGSGGSFRNDTCSAPVPMEGVVEEEPEDPIDWVDKLQSVVNHPKWEYELFVSRRASQPQWCAEIDNSSNVLRVRLRVRLDVSQSMRRRFGDEITGLGVRRFSATDDTEEGSKLYNRVAKIAAKEGFLSLEKIAQQITASATQSLHSSLSEYIGLWRGADFHQACAKAYRRAKDLIISDAHAGLYGSRVFMYGSGTTGLALNSSDVDITLVLPCQPTAIESKQNEAQSRVRIEVLSLLRRCAVKAKMQTVCLIDTAKIPVLRYWDPESKVDVDITLSSSTPILLSRFMRCHMQSDDQVWELCVCVKYWAKRRNISGVFPEGYINSIGWAIMVVFFLQHIASPHVGALFGLNGKLSNHCTIVKVPWLTHRLRDTRSRQKTSALLTRFFQFYGHEFDFHENAISLNFQTLAEAKAARINKNSPVFIEQPLVRGANVVGHVTTTSLETTLTEMRRGYFECLTSGEAEILFKERLGDVPDGEKFFDS